MKIKKNIVPIIIVLVSLAIAGVFAFLLTTNYSNALQNFNEDGYILVANKDDSSDSLNEQRYFNAGTSYKKSFDGSITFTDINDDKVSLDSKNFIHYSNDSLACLDDTVLLDTDKLDETQISYYSISNKSVLNKAGNEYTTENAGAGNLSFKNFIWKVSEQRYMIVSDEITLVVSEQSQQTFDDYIELQYIDEGVAYLVNQDGTYSTISSDAYLLLDNGIRVYIGSKNVSNEDEILVNMTQMVVDSDDNIEVIPDEDYTIEVDDQPQIVVNANDGADGEAGAAGEEGDPGNVGTKGNQGTAGGPGTQGDPGTTGKMATNAGLTYTAETLPLFSLTSDGLATTAFSVDGTIMFDSNSCEMYDGSNGYAATFMIIDNEDNTIVWKRDISYSNLIEGGQGNTLTGSLTNTAVSTLKQDTIYTLAVNATFKSPSDTTYITQQVFQQQFTTKTYDMKLAFDYSDTQSLTYSLNIGEGAIGTVTSFEIELYGVEVGGQQLLEEPYTYNTDYTLEFVSDTDLSITSIGTINIDALTEPTNVQLKFDGLDRNTTYYARIKVVSSNTGTTIPASTFDYVEGKTLKKTPTIDKPTVTVNDKENTFVVKPGNVEDFDSGVSGYRFDFYKVTVNQQTSEEEYTLVYSCTKDTLDSFSVPIASSDETESTTNMYRETDYRVQQIALFNNNISDVEVKSEYSDKFRAGGTSNWPATTISLNVYDSSAADDKKGKSAPSIIDGELYITDENHVITQASKIIIVVESNDAVYQYTTTDASSLELKTIKQTLSLSNTEALNGNPYSEGHYSIPFTFIGLKQDMTYTVRVYASEVEWDGAIDTGYASDPGVLLASTTTTTAKYTDLYIASGSGTISQNADSTFDINVEFQLDEDAYKEEAQHKITFTQNCKDKYNIADTVDLSAKAMTAVSFDIYSGQLKSSGGNEYFAPYKNLNTATGTASFMVKTSNDDDNRRNHTFATLYQFDSDFYNYTESVSGVDVTRGAYLKCDSTYKAVENIDSFTINIKSTDLGDAINDEINTYYETYKTKGPVVFIRCVAAYDYTYGLGTSVYQLYKDCNQIGIGDADKYKQSTITGSNGEKLYYTGDLYDQYVETDLAAAKPSIDHDPPYFTNNNSFVKAKGKEIIANTDDDNTVNLISSTYASADFSTLTNLYHSTSNKTTINTYWDNYITSQTTVGYEVQGDSSWLASYASAVRYTVYKNYYDDDGKFVERKEVTKSYNNSSTEYTDDTTDGWIYFDSAYATEQGLPKWYFFLDVEDSDSHLSVTRGDSFTVRMEIRLRNYKDNTGNNGLIWPETPEDKCVIEQTYVPIKQVPVIKMIQFNGTTSTSGATNDIFYATINDLDQVLQYNDEAKTVLKLYSSEDTTKGNPILATISDLSDPSGYKSVSMQLNPGNGSVVAYYDIGNGISIGTVGNTTYRTDSKVIETPITLVSESNLATGANLTMVSSDCEENSTRTGYTVSTKIRSANKEELNAIDKIVVTFTNTSNTTKTKVYTTKYDPNGSYSYDDQGTYRDTTIPTNATYKELANIANISGSTTFDVKTELYYTTGNYGVYYTSIDNGYYVLGGTIYKGNSTGLAYQPGNSEVTIPQNDTTVDLTYYAYGLNKVPEQVGYSSQTTQVVLANVKAEGDIKCINYGRNFLTVDYDITSYGTIDHDKGTEVWFKRSVDSTWTKAVVDGDDKNAVCVDPTDNTKIAVLGLETATSYDFKLVGYFNDGAGNYTETLIKERDNISTIATIDISDTSSKIAVNYDTTTAANRDTKTMDVELVLNDVNKADIKSGVKEVEVTVYKASTSTSGIFTTTLTSSDIIDKLIDNNNISDDYTKSNYSYKFSWPFEPEADKSHILNSTTESTYYAVATLKFDIPDTAPDAYKSTSTTISKKFAPWASATSDATNYFRILPSNGVDKTTDGGTTSYDFYMKYAITGSDPKRIITSDNADETNKIVYVAELFEIADNGTATLVEINNPDAISVNIDGTPHKVMYIKANTSGKNITKTEIKCSGLESNKTYQLKLFANIDVYNIDTVATPLTNGSDFSSTSDTYKSYSYSTYSQQSKSASTTSYYVYGIDLQPNNKRLVCMGEGLGEIKKITYTLYDLTADIEYPEITLTSASVSQKDIEHNIYPIGSYWTESIGSTQTYYLSMSELNDSSHNYYIIVGFYNKTTDTTPALKREGYYDAAENQANNVSLMQAISNGVNNALQNLTQE